MVDKRRKLPQGGIKGSKDKRKTSTPIGFINSTAETNSRQSEPNSENTHKIHSLSNLIVRKNPFADLVRLSLLLNPREYELPEDYIPDIQFPGTSKKPVINTVTREARLSSYSVKRAQELDRDNLPLILRTCYFCRRGFRKAPLVHCDYCPLVYHADCIDPPLTTLPSTRWMCPNHVEPIAEEKLLFSSSFSERVKLWNLFSKPVDHESIKVRFLDKVHKSSCTDSSSNQHARSSHVTSKCLTRDYEKFYVYTRKDEAKTSNELVGDTEEQMNRNEHDDFRLNEAFKQMIESSKLLESEEYRKANGETDVQEADNSTTISKNDRDAQEKEEWLSFLLGLSGFDVRENNPKQVKTPCDFLTKQELQKPNEFSNPTNNNRKSSLRPNNNVFNSGNNNKHYDQYQH